MPKPRRRVDPKDGVKYWGIDPGKSGGIVILDQYRVHTYVMPDTERDIWEVISAHKMGRNCAVIEWINPGMFGIKKSDAAKLYASYIQLRAFLTAARIPFEDIKPKVWQQVFALTPRKKNESTLSWKKRLKGKAQQLFPDLPNWSEPKSEGKQLAIADALLIAEFCKRAAR